MKVPVIHSLGGLGMLMGGGPALPPQPPKKRRLRVRAFSSRVTFEGYQVLEEKCWWGWKELDREEVPQWARIAIACLGSCDWVSKFADIPDVEWVNPRKRK